MTMTDNEREGLKAIAQALTATDHPSNKDKRRKIVDKLSEISQLASEIVDTGYNDIISKEIGLVSAFIGYALTTQDDNYTVKFFEVLHTVNELLGRLYSEEVK